MSRPPTIGASTRQAFRCTCTSSTAACSPTWTPPPSASSSPATPQGTGGRCARFDRPLPSLAHRRPSPCSSRASPPLRQGGGGRRRDPGHGRRRASERHVQRRQAAMDLDAHRVPARPEADRRGQWARRRLRRAPPQRLRVHARPADEADRHRHVVPRRALPHVVCTARGPRRAR